LPQAGTIISMFDSNTKARARMPVVSAIAAAAEGAGCAVHHHQPC
jgi:hypothetical protein